MMKPILNLNGTSAAALIEARMNAREAVLALMAALGDVAPHGRDYIGHPDAFKRDQEIHVERIRFLDRLYNELGDEALAIDTSSDSK